MTLMYYGCPCHGMGDIFEDDRPEYPPDQPTPLEIARQEILNGLPLIEYLRRTGDTQIDEWASLLAEFGTEESK
jgi:hypothetical protein